MWEDGLRLAWEHPLLGVGMDAIYRHWQDWGIRAYQRYPHLKSHFHSTYIQLAAECGFPALLAWLWLLASYMRFLVTTLSSKLVSNWFSQGVLAGTLAATVAFVSMSSVHYTLGDSEIMIVFWLLMGMSLALNRLSRSDVRPSTVTAS